MSISFREWRATVDVHQQLRIPIPVSIAVLLQSSCFRNPGKHASSRSAADRRYNRERRQVQHALDLLSRVHRVVEIFEEERETKTETDREEERADDGACAIWTNRRVGRQRVINDRDVIWLTGEHDVVLFRALEQSIEQRLIRLDLLLNDAVVDRCFVL